jgi:putative photosynthetic complex assembly protein
MHHDGRPFPRGVLLAAGALVLFTLASIVIYRGVFLPTEPAGPPAVAARDLRFEDRADGGVAVVEAASDRVLEVLAPGTNGFLRSTLRGLARDRKRQEVGVEPPFRLKRLADGRVLLEDPTTGRSVDLVAFGPTNVAAFARLLTAQSAAAQPEQ